MTSTVSIGKRDFIQHTSKYIKLAETEGSVIITHHNQPTLILRAIKQKSVHDLQGLVKEVHIDGDINEHILPGFDEW